MSPHRLVVLFGQVYEWKPRATDGGRKAPKRKKGQLLLRRHRGEDLAAVPDVWVPPCSDRIYRPIPGLQSTS